MMNALSAIEAGRSTNIQLEAPGVTGVWGRYLHLEVGMAS
jgi:hypothetical protein